ncbi:ABC transporter permease [Streptomyces sp. SPB074]|uniref:ABC transporter permease n=1 Tax=Streptomyces sp. (strain SPB074) TaxID=465543 RepID=UPI00017F1AB5|nr:ABC transporter permease [Streptomyces sp. SPB074]
MSEAAATPRAAKAARYGFVFAFPFVMVMLLVGIYVSSMHAPEPHDLPVAVVGSGAQAERSVAALDAADGSPADARLLGSVSEARRQLHDREIAGALVLPEDGGRTAQLWTAQAAGASQTMDVTRLLTPVAAGAHLTVEPHEAAPLPPDDQGGMGVLYLSVGAMLAGYMAVTVASSGMPGLLRLRKLVPVLAGWSALMSVVVWTIAGPVIGAVSGHVPDVLGAVFLGIFAVGLTQAFLTRLFGPVAVIAGITLFMFLGVPASNLALSIHTLPGFFGFLHHVLPLPALGEALRALVYFDGDGAGVHLLTLGIWALAALLLSAGFDVLKRRKTAGKAATGTAATPPSAPATSTAPATSAPATSASTAPAAPASSATPPAPARKAPHPAVQLVLLGAFPFLMVVLMVGLMLGGMHKPLPRDLPVAVVSSSAQTAEQMAAGLGKSLGSSFDIRALDSAGEARRQIRDREIAGAYVLPAPGAQDGAKATILSAGGAGMSQQQVVQRTFGQIAAQQGVPVRNVDLAPLPAHDGMGTVTLYLAIGFTMSGFLVVTIMSVAARELLRVRRLLPVLAGWAVLMATAVWLLAGPVIGAVHGHAWQILGVGALMVFTVSLVTAVFARFLGPLAVIPVVTLMMFLGVPASNGGVALHMVPGFFQALHGVLPLPAVVESIRSVLYFGAEGIGGHLGTLAVWGGAALVLNVALDLFQHRPTRDQDLADPAALVAAELAPGAPTEALR